MPGVVVRRSWSSRRPVPSAACSLCCLAFSRACLWYCRCCSAHTLHLVWSGMGGAPHATQSPRDLASCRFAWAWRSLFSLRSCLCSYSCRFCSLASTSAGVGSTRGFGFFTFWLALADFLLDLGLFGVRMTKVLSKMRSLEPPACSGRPPLWWSSRQCGCLEVWPESHWLGFALRQPDVLQSYTAW